MNPTDETNPDPEARDIAFETRILRGALSRLNEEEVPDNHKAKFVTAMQEHLDARWRDFDSAGVDEAIDLIEHSRSQAIDATVSIAIAAQIERRARREFTCRTGQCEDQAVEVEVANAAMFAAGLHYWTVLLELSFINGSMRARLHDVLGAEPDE